MLTSVGTCSRSLSKRLEIEGNSFSLSLLEKSSKEACDAIIFLKIASEFNFDFSADLELDKILVKRAIFSIQINLQMNELLIAAKIKV